MSVSNVCVSNESEKICNVYGCFEFSKPSMNFCENHLSNCRLNDPDDCPICMEKLNYKTHLQCGHCFHDDCIDSWFSSNNTCPLCRQKYNGQENDIKYQLGYPVLERSDGYYNDETFSNMPELASDNTYSENELIFMDDENVSVENSIQLVDNEIISISYVQNEGNEFEIWIREQISLYVQPEHYENLYHCITNNEYFLRQCFIYFYNKENVDAYELRIFFNFIRISL